VSRDLYNARFFPAFDVIAPPGTIANAMPAPGLTGFRMADTGLALGPILPDRIRARRPTTRVRDRLRVARGWSLALSCIPNLFKLDPAASMKVWSGPPSLPN